MNGTAYMIGYIRKCTANPKLTAELNIVPNIKLFNENNTKALARASHDPQVLIAIVSGLNRYRAVICSVKFSEHFRLCKMEYTSFPQYTSHKLNKTLPNSANQNTFGVNIHANKGVYRYVFLSYGDWLLYTYLAASVNTS